MDRQTFLITGSDAREFLQGLVTNDVDRIENGLVYAALLTPQGKYIADFFLSRHGDGILLDVAESHGDMVAKRLSMYRLRADVKIAPAGRHVHVGTGDLPDNALADPRNPAMGWRAYRDHPQTDDATDWAALRVAHMVPETGIELTPESYILEAGFERLNGVDFRKGCYVGQEVTARMKHKTELKKGLAKVAVEGEADQGAAITADGKPAGTLFTRAGGDALAYLRFDRATGEMRAGEAVLRRTDG